MTLRALSAATAAALFCIALSSSSATAYPTGFLGASGAAGATCLMCHRISGGPVPSVVVTGLDRVLTEGQTALLTVSVRTNDPRGGIPPLCPNRCGGFDASTDEAGAFVVVPGSGTRVSELGEDVTHTARHPMVRGRADFPVALTHLVAGQHTLYVAANDADGVGSIGDRVTAVQLPFTVMPVDGGVADDAARVGAAADEVAVALDEVGDGGVADEATVVTLAPAPSCAATTPALAGGWALVLAAIAILMRAPRR